MAKALTLGELADLLGGELRGPPDLVIRGLAPVDLATPEDITFIARKSAEIFQSPSAPKP